MADLEIIGAPMSNFVRTVRMAAHEKGVAATLTAAGPHSPAVDAIHPFGQIPVMRHGALELCESRAICGYIDQAFEGPALMPRNPAAAARAEQWCSLVAHQIDQSMLRAYGLAYFFPGTADGKPDPARVQAALPKLEKAFAVVEKELAANPYLGGDSFTLADMFLLPIVHYMKMLPESGALMARSPGLSAWHERVAARASAQATVPVLPQKG